MPLSSTFRTPPPVQGEHETLHRKLMSLARSPGRIGAVAEEVAGLVHLHTQREDALAMPLLGLLPHLAAGRVTRDMAPAIFMAGELRAELSRMLEEHIAIVAALRRLIDLGCELDRPDAAEFAARLISHAELEEHVLYPAAIVAGEFVGAKL